jgi:uncharacterized protein (DUF362 family)
MLVLAAAEAFRRLGAKSVVVAEGPGHQRDTHLVLSQSGYQQSLRDERIRFADLNRRRTDTYTASRQLHRDERALAPSDSARDGLSGVNAEDLNPGLVSRSL